MATLVVILILAAGSASRMRGRDKLLEPVHGEPVLRRQVRLALATGCPVIVALSPDHPKRRGALAGTDATLIDVPDAATGMAASLRQALRVARTMTSVAEGVMILPADMPDFTEIALKTVASIFASDPQRIVQATSATGTPGHPVIFPRDLWQELGCITGDTGGRAVLRAHLDRRVAVPLPGDMAITDLDTPEAWAAWRTGRPASSV